MCLADVIQLMNARHLSEHAPFVRSALVSHIWYKAVQTARTVRFTVTTQRKNRKKAVKMVNYKKRWQINENSSWYYSAMQTEMPDRQRIEPINRSKDPQKEKVKRGSRDLRFQILDDPAYPESKHLSNGWVEAR